MRLTATIGDIARRTSYGDTMVCTIPVGQNNISYGRENTD